MSSEVSPIDQLMEPWRTNHRINLFLIDRISPEGIGVSVGYLIAHESHLRGNILLTLKQCGHKVDSETQYAIWDWDRM